jgi:coproporphyrinogen III oxidase-like Fe-S oxidoreductase
VLFRSERALVENIQRADLNAIEEAEAYARLVEQAGIRRRMLEAANQLLTASGYDAIGMDHDALRGDSLAVAAREGNLHRNFQGYTTGGGLELLGVGPTAISQFPHLFSQNQRDLKA